MRVKRNQHVAPGGIKVDLIITPAVASMIVGDGDIFNVNFTGLQNGVTYTFVIQALDVDRCFDPIGIPITGMYYQQNISKGNFGIGYKLCCAYCL